MVCCLAVFIAFFPRLGTLLIWLARPTMFSAAFGGSWLWPILGIIFLPFTTLMYVILWSPGIGLTTWDWLWLFLAVALDVMHWGQSAYSNRDRIPGYASTPSTPSAPSTPSTPSAPSTPSTPSAPSTPSTPSAPSTPSTPSAPSTPSTPSGPPDTSA